MIERFSSASRFEPSVGYSRALRAGPLVLVAGTTATGPDGELVGEGNPYLQARQALRNVERALAEAGAGLADVVQRRIRRAPGEVHVDDEALEAPLGGRPVVKVDRKAGLALRRLQLVPPLRALRHPPIVGSGRTKR